MAKMSEITVEVSVRIPDETIARCAQLIEMWLDDDPHRELVVERLFEEDGIRHRIHLKQWEPKEAPNAQV